MLAQLPRFERIWSREGLGTYQGIADGGVYYTVENSGRTVHAVDLATGRSLWQSTLLQPVTNWAEVQLVRGGLMIVSTLASEGEGPRAVSPGVVLTRLSKEDGRALWTKQIACRASREEVVGGRLYLQCDVGVDRQKLELVEIDPEQGGELARVPLRDDVELAADGQLCGLSQAALWCGRIAGNAIQIAWQEPRRESLYNISVSGEWLIAGDDSRLAVRRVKDGGIAWQRSGKYWPHVVAGDQRLILTSGERTAKNEAGQQVVTDGVLEVVRLSDGGVLAKQKYEKGVGDVHSGAGLIVIEASGAGDDPVLVVDAQSRIQTLAPNVMFFDHVSAGVLLSRNVGMSGWNREAAPLDAYSLTRFAPPYARLPPHEQVLAVLGLASSWVARYTLELLQPIPNWQASIERVIAEGPSELRGAALDVAGETGDPRYAALVSRVLAAIQKPPTTQAEWSHVVAVASALSAIESPEGTASLLAFWQKMGPGLLPWRREVLRGMVSSAVYRYSARKDWVSCQNTVLPVTRVAREQAVIGTKSPGVVSEVSRAGDWAAICQARSDDDGNGKLEVLLGHHGDTGGDELQPYLVLGTGPGTLIDDFVAADQSGKWVAILKDLCLHLVDAQSGKTIALRGADGRPGDAVVGAHRAASFSPDGTGMVYIKSDGERATVIHRNLATGKEQSIDPGPGELSQAFFDPSGRFVIMEVIARDSDKDGKLRLPRIATTLGARRCRGPAISASFFGQLGDSPIQRYWPVTGGNVADMPQADVVRPAELPPPRFRLFAEGQEQHMPHAPLPLGPFHWQP